LNRERKRLALLVRREFCPLSYVTEVYKDVGFYMLDSL
jgi:hypothetical protein